MLAEGHRGGLVFVDVDGGPLRASNVYRRLFAEAIKRAKVPRIAIDDMRHPPAR